MGRGPGSRTIPPRARLSLAPHLSQATAGMSVGTAKLDWGRFGDGKRPWSRTKRRTDQHGRTGRSARASSGGRRARRAGERRRAELGEFLKARRARLSPGDFGMPPGSRRRTPGLRREEVALLAGVGVTWYTWLEQGRQINASTQVLDAVARTLRLDRAEREHLYRLAEATPLRTECSRQAVPDTIREIVAFARPAPGVPAQQPVRHPAVATTPPRSCSGSGTRCRASTRTPCGAASPSRPPGASSPSTTRTSATWWRGCARRTAGTSATRTGKRTSAGWPA